MITYIIKTGSEEFYCGKTINLDQRLKQHRTEHKPSWFGIKLKRKDFIEIIVFYGDFEKFIKRAGVNKVYQLIKSQRPAP